MKRLEQSGSSGFELILALVVLAIIAITGLLVFNRHNSSSPTASTAAKPAASVSSAPAVNSAGDLNKASATLDQNDPGSANSSDSTQLNSQLAGY